MIADIFPRHRLAFAMSVFGIGTALGGALALAVGGVIIDWLDSAPPFVLPLIGEMQSWQMIFLIVGLPRLAAAFPKIGSASCRERECVYVLNLVVPAELKQKKH